MRGGANCCCCCCYYLWYFWNDNENKNDEFDGFCSISLPCYQHSMLNYAIRLCVLTRACPCLYEVTFSFFRVVYVRQMTPRVHRFYTPATSLDLLFRPGRCAEYFDQLVCMSVCLFCLSVCLSVREHISGALNRSARDFVCRSHVVVARSSSGGVALRYVLPVLWMTSRFTENVSFQRYRPLKLPLSW